MYAQSKLPCLPSQGGQLPLGLAGVPLGFHCQALYMAGMKRSSAFLLGSVVPLCPASIPAASGTDLCVSRVAPACARLGLGPGEAD